MNLYLVRHAEALPLGEGGINQDEDRPLSAAGFQQAARLAAAWQRLGLPLDCVVSSPLVRARQTAAELARIHPGLEPMIVERLAPAGGKGFKKLARLVGRLEGEHVALVGHMPDLGVFAGWLVGNKKARIDLAKSGVAFISCEGLPAKGAGTLVWMVTPEWLA